MMSLSGAMHGGGLGQYLAIEDYMSAQAKSMWMGGKAQVVGLTGELDGTSFRSLLRGYSVDGKTPLVQNAGQDNCQSYWDAAFSASKSVSFLRALSPPKSPKQIERAMFASVPSVIAFVESEFAHTRRGKAGEKLLRPKNL